MKKNDYAADLLNTLLKTNVDRIKGYELAAKDTLDLQVELRAVFYKMADESRRFQKAIEIAILSEGGTPEQESTTGGNIFRIWMKLNTSINRSGAAAVLNSCVFGENVAIVIYRKVFMKFNGNRAIQELIQNQYDSLQASRYLIKRYRNEYSMDTRFALS